MGWDPSLAKTNLFKHGIYYEETTTVFSDHNSLTIDAPLHSAREKRNIA